MQDDRSLAVGPDHDLTGWCALCGRRHDRFRFAGMSQKTGSTVPGERLLSFFVPWFSVKNLLPGLGLHAPSSIAAELTPVPEGRERTQKNEPKGQGEYGKGSATG